MGCNCRKNRGIIAEAVKNSDEGEKFYRPNILGRLLKGILQLAMALLVMIVVAAFTPLALIYIAVCIAIGKEPSFRLINLNKHINARKQKLPNSD